MTNAATLTVHVDDASTDGEPPSESEFRRWSDALAPYLKRDASLCLRIVNRAEMTELNERFRQRPGATNVLSFPAELEFSDLEHGDTLNHDFLGDIAICADIVIEESRQQHKRAESHWAHLFVHGVLHLLGYDHVDDHDAHEMEGLETRILLRLNYPAPYEYRSNETLTETKLQ